MWAYFTVCEIRAMLWCSLSDVNVIRETRLMSQHSFGENATITHLSHSIPSLFLSLSLSLSLWAGMSVKDKTVRLSHSDQVPYRTIKPKKTPLARRSLHYTFTLGKKITSWYLNKANVHSKSYCFYNDSQTLVVAYSSLLHKIQFSLSVP